MASRYSLPTTAAERWGPSASPPTVRESLTRAGRLEHLVGSGAGRRTGPHAGECRRSELDSIAGAQPSRRDVLGADRRGHPHGNLHRYREPLRTTNRLPAGGLERHGASIVSFARWQMGDRGRNERPAAGCRAAWCRSMEARPDTVWVLRPRSVPMQPGRRTENGCISPPTREADIISGASVFRMARRSKSPRARPKSKGSRSRPTASRLSPPSAKARALCGFTTRKASARSRSKDTPICLPSRPIGSGCIICSGPRRTAASSAANCGRRIWKPARDNACCRIF